MHESSNDVICRFYSTAPIILVMVTHLDMYESDKKRLHSRSKPEKSHQTKLKYHANVATLEGCENNEALYF